MLSLLKKLLNFDKFIKKVSLVLTKKFLEYEKHNYCINFID